jgi:diguanylate cyclase (GGDEF)-like protein
VPVTFLGSSIGVLRTVTEPDRDLADHESEDLPTIAAAAGTHIGTMRAFARSQTDAEQDALTGLLNRRGLDSAVAKLQRENTPFVVVLADLDHFKEVNDTHGHDAGDVALVETAAIMTSVLRPGDILARHGGDEFVIIVPITGEAATEGRELIAGVSAAERVRSSIAAHHEMSSTPSCTVSLGVSGPAKNGLDLALRAADQALYRAKQLGRNRVEVDGFDELTGSADFDAESIPVTDSSDLHTAAAAPSEA